MEKVEILISAMHQKDMSIAFKCNADTDVLIINQCDYEAYDEIEHNGHKIRMISTKERGLSRSRNMAINNAKGDICMICDDDVVYRDGYLDAVVSAFNNKPDANIIAFNVEHRNARHSRKMNKRFCRARIWKTYGSWCLGFKRKSVLEKKVFFNVNFGAGSNKITHGEESIWQHDAKKKGLLIYQHPFCIADVEQATSTWFEGYNEKYFYNMGAYLSVVAPIIKVFLKYYYVIRLYNVCKLSIKSQIQWLNNGMEGYRNEWSYEEYMERRVLIK